MQAQSGQPLKLAVLTMGGSPVEALLSQHDVHTLASPKRATAETVFCTETHNYKS
jgi:hypothetical protein